VQIYAIKGANEGVVHKGHVRGDVDYGVGELEGLAGWEEGRNGKGGGVGLTGLSLPGVSRSLKGWSAQTPSGFPLGDILGVASVRTCSQC
jgi:hypothetical protein